jgi:hypothetical protein
LPGVHVPIGSQVEYDSNPPSSGPHYPIWAAFRVYTSPVPRPYYVHDLEHGAVVLVYNCALLNGGGTDAGDAGNASDASDATHATDSSDASDASDGSSATDASSDAGAETCDQVVAALQAASDAIPDDPLCTQLNEGVRVRTVITPDPLLDVPVAAASWGWVYRADCIDLPSLKAFAIAHYGQGTEDFCYNGTTQF